MAEKELNPAEQFIRKIQLAFPSLYPCEDALIEDFLHATHYEWNAEGFIQYDYKCDLTPKIDESGWNEIKYAHQNFPLQYWHAPNSKSVLLNIPDNAQDCWIQEILSFCFYVDRLDKDNMKAYLDILMKFKGYAKDYADADIERNYSGFLRAKEAVKEIQKRIEDIFVYRHQQRIKLNPQPLQVEIGATVRYKTGLLEESAKVIDMETPLDSDYSFAVCILDTPIKGQKIHFQKNLIAL